MAKERALLLVDGSIIALISVGIRWRCRVRRGQTGLCTEGVVGVKVGLIRRAVLVPILAVGRRRLGWMNGWGGPCFRRTGGSDGWGE